MRCQVKAGNGTSFLLPHSAHFQITDFDLLDLLCFGIDSLPSFAIACFAWAL
jgi:hypothetical protein